MSAQLSLLDDERARLEAILAAWQADHPGYLRMARAIAVEIAQRTGEVTIDDLLERMDALAIPRPDAIADARFAGAILRGCSALAVFGPPRMSRRPNRIRAGVGGGMIAVYRLREDVLSR